MNLCPTFKELKPSTGLENERKCEVVRRRAPPPHSGIELDGIFRLVDGDEAADHGIPMEDVPWMVGSMEEEAGVRGVAGVEVGGEEVVDEMGVLDEAEAEGAGMDGLGRMASLREEEKEELL